MSFVLHYHRLRIHALSQETCAERTGEEGSACQRRLLTWKFVHVFSTRCLITAAEFAHEFVAGSQNDDAKERDDEGKSGGNMPLAKDDAEVACVPSEEHLWRVKDHYVYFRILLLFFSILDSVG